MVGGITRLQRLFSVIENKIKVKAKAKVE